MKNATQINNVGLTLGTLRKRSPSRRRFLFILFTLGLGSLAWLPVARATCPEVCDGLGNTAFNSDLFNNNGFYNTAIGQDTLSENISGSYNTALGYKAQGNGSYGSYNTALGYNAQLNGFDGSYNTATGYQALFYNTEGSDNTADGVYALYNNISGASNTATGRGALYSNTTASNNTADGYHALNNNTTGTNNTATGRGALYSNTTASENTADGNQALNNNTTGTDNTASGASALYTNTTGNSNIALGDSAGLNLTTGSNNIDIGNTGKAGESNYIRIGTKGTHTHTLIAGISGVTVAGGVGVIIDTNGKLGTVVSSERFKDQVEPMDKASEAILSLKPVTFRYKKELEPDGIPQFGLVAEQVEKVDPELVARDDQGKPYSVRYEAVNAMLLNEFLKEHRKGQEQDATISQLKAELAHQQKQIQALTAGLQRVSAQVDMSRPAPQVVNNNQ